MTEADEQKPAWSTGGEDMSEFGHRYAALGKSDRKVIAYRLEPVYEPVPGSIGTAAVMECALTGKMLCGSGGGGLFLSPEIVEMLRCGKLRVIDQELCLMTEADEHEQRLLALEREIIAMREDMEAAIARAEAAEERVAELEEALRPFANVIQNPRCGWTLGALQRLHALGCEPFEKARAILTHKKEVPWGPV